MYLQSRDLGKSFKTKARTVGHEQEHNKNIGDWYGATYDALNVESGDWPETTMSNTYTLTTANSMINK